MPTEEKVLCFKRELLDKLGVFQGLSPDIDKYLPPLTASANTLYKNRSEAELDRNFKQLIPYVLIICGDKILRYQRGKKGGETRLHGLYSVGIGGHISDEDSGLFSSAAGYHEGMRRELMEEVDVAETNDAAVAVINDDTTDVGQVHFGVVHILYVPDENVATRRSGINTPEFITIAEAVKDAAGYESWSKFCLENMDLLLAKAAAAGIIAPEKGVK